MNQNHDNAPLVELIAAAITQPINDLRNNPPRVQIIPGDTQGEILERAAGVEAEAMRGIARHAVSVVLAAGFRVPAKPVPLADVLAAHRERIQSPAGCSCGERSDHLAGWHPRHLAAIIEKAGYGATK